MKVAIVIATTGRPEIAATALRDLERQTRQPDRIVVSLTQPSDLGLMPRSGTNAVCDVLIGQKGLTLQRNAALDALAAEDVVLFLDDDFVMADDYLEQMEAVFDRHDSIAAVTGRVLADGIRTVALTIEEARDRLRLDVHRDGLLVDVNNGYGCNMAFRMAPVRQHAIRFDAALPLYGWLEDVDFSRRVAAYGRCVRAEGLRGVHLGVKGGRTSGIRLGYSQVANPVYLVNRGTMQSGHATRLISRNMCANALKSVNPEPWIDRRGRLRGNLLALGDLARGQLDPRRIATLDAPAIVRPHDSHDGAPRRAVILNDTARVRGGGSYLATFLAKALRDRGWPVTFIAGDDGSGFAEESIDLVALGGRRLTAVPAAALGGLYDRTVAARIQEWIATHDTPGTVYHLHNWSGILSPSVFDALAPVAARCVIHAHDFFLACPNGAFLDYPRGAVCQRVPLSMECLTTQCDKRSYSHKLWRSARQKVLFGRLEPFLEKSTFVIINEAMRPWLEQALRPRRMIAINNPVEAFGPHIDSPERNDRFFHVGQIQRLKGVFDLAEAGRRLNRQIDFVGDGEDLETLRTRYPEHVYHGWTAREDIGALLRHARAAVVATRSPEPFCLSAFETTATGLPIVISDSVLSARTLAESGAALLFDAGNPAALTETLHRLANDDALAARLAAAARSEGLQLTNSLVEWVDAHCGLYEGLLAAKTCGLTT